MLRRQAIRPLRKPLIVMSPKSLLRHKEAISTLEELAHGHFNNVLDETDDLDKSKVRRVIICSGKVYYDLRATRRERGIDDIAILRLEQLYPFPEAELLQVLTEYTSLEDAVWCQEEPMNQGAWYASQHHMRTWSSSNSLSTTPWATCPGVIKHYWHFIKDTKWQLKSRPPLFPSR
jgi:2-oxoglutarate dehydrogenase E1 component